MTDGKLILESSMRALSSSVGSPKLEHRCKYDAEEGSSSSELHPGMEDDDRPSSCEECCETISHL